MTGRRLGLKPRRNDPRTLRLASYVKTWPAPPPARDWTDRADQDFGKMQNDRLGDCAIVAPAHAVQCWTSQRGAEVTIGDGEVVSAYRAVGGYDPTRPETDTGCVMLDAMNYWRQVGIGGHRISAFVSVDPRNRIEIEGAINLFGGVLFGFAMPLAAHTQTVWDVAPPGNHDDSFKPGSWGGHAVFCPVYSRVGIGVITWGALKLATWEWEMTYASEAYAALSEEWAPPEGAAPNGFNLQQLRDDLAAIGV